MEIEFIRYNKYKKIEDNPKTGDIVVSLIEAYRNHHGVVENIAKEDSIVVYYYFMHTNELWYAIRYAPISQIFSYNTLYRNLL